MAVRGRKPKPTHLHVVTGTFRANRHPLSEPQPEGEVIRPRFLKGRAARIWDEYAPELIRIGTLRSVDAHMFAAWCSLASELEQDPERMTAARIAQLRALASCFGMDASSRARLGTGAEKSADPEDEFLR